MSNIVEKLAEVGIRLPSYQPGDRKILCPKCSHERRHRTDPCLSVHVDPDGENATWMCHHCDWRGSTNDVLWRELPLRKQAPRRLEAPPRLEKPPPVPTDGMYEWFERRGIPRSVVDDAKIGLTTQYFASLGRQAPAIAFPYYRGGELVNTKYRAINHKCFSQQKGGLQCFYGLDDLTTPNGDYIDDERLIIVEGELDKLAADACEIPNCISVPDGAPSKLKDEVSEHDAKFAYLGLDHELLDGYHKFVIAVDNDGPGAVLAEELARRLGKERCYRVRWPDGGDAPCKDLNETLMLHGEKVVQECIDNAEPYPIKGYHQWNRILLHERKLLGRERGVKTGWSNVDELFTIAPGQLTVVTGVPNHGKSEFLDALMVNLAMHHDWKFALCSFENSIAEHQQKIAEKYLGQPFWDGPTRSGMTTQEIDEASDWGEQHFTFIRMVRDEEPTIDWVLEKARVAVLRDGIHGLVIDPYNELEHTRPQNMTETEYVSKMLGRVKHFAQNHAIHCWFVAHPAKMKREGGKMPEPNLYDISGSANWANKADIGFAVHRDFDTNSISLNVQKVRHKWIGKPGRVELNYDRVTGRFSEPEVRSHYTDRY